MYPIKPSSAITKTPTKTHIHPGGPPTLGIAVCNRSCGTPIGALPDLNRRDRRGDAASHKRCAFDPATEKDGGERRDHVPPGVTCPAKTRGYCRGSAGGHTIEPPIGAAVACKRRAHLPQVGALGTR